jgi:hypothetical protein
MIEPIQVPQGARYAISVDGKLRTHRDKREVALEAANVLKAPLQQDRDPRSADGRGNRSAEAVNDRCRAYTGPELLDLSLTVRDRCC